MKAKASRTAKGNIKLTVVLSTESAQYLEALLGRLDPKEGVEDPWSVVDVALKNAGVSTNRHDRADLIVDYRAASNNR